uniref:Uncharacterized protein n=1 Tax=Ciona savignyi TaxID=51511 RepID=H2YU23_CIOSA
NFGTFDLVIFSASLIFSVFVGLYYAYKDRTNDSLNNYYFGGRKMSPIPIGLSMSVTFISALTVIGLPVEVYLYGLVNVWHSTTLFLPSILSYLYIIPLYHRLQISTVYETLYMGTTIYLPALALSAVTPINMNQAIAVTSAICTIYTVCGGLKAVVWTDTFQTGIMFVGTLAVLIQGTIVAGGANQVWEALERGGRINMFDLDLDPRRRVSFWSLLIGGNFAFIHNMCCGQMIVQRFLSCRSVKDARIAAFVSVISKLVITLIPVGCGAVAFAYFEHCDPLKSGKISKVDQLLPYMVLEIFDKVPGVAGLFVAAAYSGTMSSVSSGINSASAMILQDFILPNRPLISAKWQMFISKITGVAFGVLVMGIAYLSSFYASTAVSLAYVYQGVCSGPVIGVYLLGIFFPWSNTAGVMAGQFVGTAATLWIALGSLINGRDPATDGLLPVQTDSCTNFTSMKYTTNMQWNSSIESIDMHSEFKRNNFGTFDLVIFSASLIFSVLVGLYYAYKDRTNDSVNNYYFGGRKMSPIPIGLSMSVTFISALTIIGLPAEVYWYGLVNYCRITLYMGTTIYLPALALSAVTPINMNQAIAVTSAICTIYTVCGGLKAVVWTDTFQTGIMFVGTLAVLIQGTIVAGGANQVWEALERGGRINMFDLDLDPRRRVSFWSLLIGGNFAFIHNMCCGQIGVQRFLSCRSVKDARIAAFVSVIPKFIITLIPVGCGAVAFAYFEHCDPLKSGKISKVDQLLPYMVLEIFDKVPGVAGLFVAAAYSGTMSSVSSGINSASAMILQDFILPNRPSISAKWQMFISKITGVAFGVLVMGIAYLSSFYASTAVSLSYVYQGVCSGPVIGVYLLGIFFPWSN